MLEAHLDRRCCSHAGHARPGKGQLQVVEHQKHVARGHQRAGRQQLGQARQADQELVEDGGGAAVGQGAGHAREELARCRAVGEALRVAARVDDERALAVPRLGQPGQGRAARADAPAARVWHDRETRGGRQQARLPAPVELPAIRGRLPIVARGQEDQVPAAAAGRARGIKRREIPLPVVAVGLAQEGRGARGVRFSSVRCVLVRQAVAGHFAFAARGVIQVRGAFTVGEQSLLRTDASHPSGLAGGHTLAHSRCPSTCGSTGF